MECYCKSAMGSESVTVILVDGVSGCGANFSRAALPAGRRIAFRYYVPLTHLAWENARVTPDHPDALTGHSCVPMWPIEGWAHGGGANLQLRAAQPRATRNRSKRASS
jgi:hypothetical protein